MFLTLEHGRINELKEKLPPTIARELYLRGGVSPLLDLTPSPFGKPVHFVYLGYEIRDVQEFIKVNAKLDTSNVFLIAPLGRWNLYLHKLKSSRDIEVVNEFDTFDLKVELVKDLTGLKAKEAKTAVKFLRGNFTLIEKNLGVMQEAARTKVSVEMALLAAKSYSYTDILFYLCGSKRHSRKDFMHALTKYRYGSSKLLKYLRKVIDAYINLKLEGELPKDSSLEYTLKQLSDFLYLEDALELQILFYKVKHVEQLLLIRKEVHDETN